MALTISIEGKGVIANSDGLSDSAGGTWAELGGGSISLSTETYLSGSSCVAGAYSNKAGWHYYDIGAGNELDFTPSTGAEAEQHIYLPIFFPTPGLGPTKANGGTVIRIGSSTTDYREFMISASDDFNGWDGSWKTFVLDPTKSGSVADTGTFDISSVRYIGIYMDAQALAKGDNIFISQISVGFGLRITGDSTTGWLDAVNYCTDYSNRVWPMLQKREGIFYGYGTIFIGDAASQSAAVSFSDLGRILQFGISEYWSGSAWVTSADIDYCGIVIEDHTSYATTFIDGVIVGSDNGRSGSNIIGNANHNVSLDLFGGNNAASVTSLYGTGLKGLTGLLVSGNDADHKFFGCQFLKSSQFNPVGAPVIRNCTFAETADSAAALLWNESIDVQKCSFIANTLGAAIEHAAQGSFNFDALSFSGNTYDVLYSAAASSGVLTINAQNGSDPSSYEIANPTGNSVDIQNPKTKTFAGLPENTEVRVRQGSYTLDHVQNVTGGSYPFNYSPDDSKPARVQFTLPGYVFEPVDILLNTDSQTFPVSVKPDPSYM